ncbi:MAG: hypothetical protein ABI439_08085 [Rhodospirillales bacterium]
MKIRLLTASLAAAVVLGGAAAQAATMQAKPADTCSLTSQANEVRRIVLVKLPNSYYGHRGYDANGKMICNSEWSATMGLNLQAAETLRAKGDNKATIDDHLLPRQ